MKILLISIFVVLWNSVSAQVECNFDKNNLCGFANSKGNKVDWQVRRDSTPSKGTGPTKDYSGNGYYVYMEASSPIKQGDKAMLESPSVSGPKCLRFAAHMLGYRMGSLKVKIKLESNIIKDLLEIKGNMGENWHNYAEDIEESGSYKVVFEGIRGGSYRSDIALDEISIKSEPCDGKPIPTTQRPTTEAPQLPVQCNFNQANLCEFVNSKNDVFEWTLKRGSTPSEHTGPSTDTSGNGYYVYIETSNPRKPNDNAILESPRVSGETCLQFSSHMLGGGIGTLKVLIRTDYGSSRKIFEKIGEQGNKWNTHHVHIQERQGYKVLFEGITGRDYRGDIALDEISITRGRCSNPPSPPVPSTPSPPTPSPPTPSPPTPSPPKPGSCGQKGRGLSDNPRIVGGQEAQPGEWPWQVALLKGTFRFCGGSLVSDQYVVTAAHCVKSGDWSSVKILLGDHHKYQDSGHEKVVKIATNGIKVHPSYRGVDYDIAIIKLDQKVQFTSRIKPVCINKGIDFTGQRCYTTGWGRLSSGGSSPSVLQEVQVPIVSHDECKSAYGSLTSRMLCAGYKQGGKDACQGDSGGPLVCQHSDGSWYLTGVTSWGKGCALANYYGVYAHVANLKSFIRQHTGL